MPGKDNIVWAKISGIMPARLIIKGKFDLTGYGHTIANTPSGEQNRHIAPSLLDEDNDKDRQSQNYRHKDQQQSYGLSGNNNAIEVVGNTGNNTREDDEG